jgi:hypothetical protein
MVLEALEEHHVVKLLSSSWSRWTRSERYVDEEESELFTQERADFSRPELRDLACDRRDTHTA